MRFKIGDYVISRMPNGNYWISKVDEDGMEADATVFEGWLDLYWRDHFRPKRVAR